jgi:hypothetical protein
MADLDTDSSITTLDHLLIDVHEILRRLHDLETRLAKYEALGDAALRLQDGARMRRLGRGTRNARNQDSPAGNTASGPARA